MRTGKYNNIATIFKYFGEESRKKSLNSGLSIDHIRYLDLNLRDPMGGGVNIRSA